MSSFSRSIHLAHTHRTTLRWWSYNTTIGKPYVLGRVPKDISRGEVAWSYDNTKNTEEFTDEWTESWTNSNSATLTVTNSGALFSVDCDVAQR